MNKLTVIFITGLMCCVLCSCAPELTLDQRRSAAFAAHPEWSYEVKRSIERKELLQGMTVEQVELAWGMYLTCEYAGASGRARYVGYNCCSAHAQALLRGKEYSQMYYGNLHGTYSFWFKDGELEDWSWSPSCYFSESPLYYW